MEALLREYAVIALKLSLFISIALNLAHPKQEKAMRISLGVILLSVIMLPLVDIIVNNELELKLPEFSGEINTEMSDDMIETAFEDGIREYICTSYDLPDTDVRVMADGFDLSSMTAKRLYVTLNGEGIYIDYRSLSDRLAKEFTRGGECRIELDIG